MLRLNKYLAQAGLGSRRAVEQLILAGVVRLNGQVVSNLSTLVNEQTDRVEVGGEEVRPARSFSYYLLNKPRGYDVTRGGRHHHRRAYDLLPEGVHPSVQSVGRLDRDSTGLLIFTNDGDLAFRLMHPRHGCQKIYEVEVEGEPDGMDLDRLRDGVMLEDGLAQAVNVERVPVSADSPVRLCITMQEGRKHIVRRMCEAIGHPVVTLNRTHVGPLQLGSLRRGGVRELTAAEVRLLRLSVDLPVDSTQRSPSRPARKPRPAAGSTGVAKGSYQKPQTRSAGEPPRGRTARGSVDDGDGTRASASRPTRAPASVPPVNTSPSARRRYDRSLGDHKAPATPPARPPASRSHPPRRKPRD
jgi:pseudouridine synthase